MVTKKLMSALGALFLVLSAIFALLGLSYVIYWGPAPETLPVTVATFPLYAFWLGVILFIIGIIGFAASAYSQPETSKPPSAQ